MTARAPMTSLTKADDDADDDTDVSLGAGLYLAGVLEYLIAEILHKAVAQNAHRPNRIEPHQILQAICNDPELTQLFPDFRLLEAKTSSEAITSQSELCSEELWLHGGDCQQPGIYIKKNHQLKHFDVPHDDALEVLHVFLEHRLLHEEVFSIYPGFKQRLITDKGVFSQAELLIENQDFWKGIRNRGLQETFVQCMVYVRRGTSQIQNAVKSLTDTFGVHMRGALALVENYLF